MIQVAVGSVNLNCRCRRGSCLEVQPIVVEIREDIRLEGC